MFMLYVEFGVYIFVVSYGKEGSFSNNNKIAYIQLSYTAAYITVNVDVSTKFIYS